MTIISKILGIFSNDDEKPDPNGADAVRQAMNELSNIGEQKFEAVLEEPKIVDETTAEFFNNPKVKIELSNGPLGSSPSLLFDLDDPNFENLLKVNGVNIDSMERLAGNAVPVMFRQGNVIVDWMSLEDEQKSEKTDKGEGKKDSESNPKDEQKSEKADKGEGKKGSESNNGVKVNEKSVSPDSGGSDD